MVKIFLAKIFTFTSVFEGNQWLDYEPRGMNELHLVRTMDRNFEIINILKCIRNTRESWLIPRLQVCLDKKFKPLNEGIMVNTLR